MIFAWWMTCICDAYASAYYRRKPVLDDDDYDIDFYTVDPVHADMLDSAAPTPSPREQLEVGLVLRNYTGVLLLGALFWMFFVWACFWRVMEFVLILTRFNFVSFW